MRLKSLHIHGFKSFAKKADLTFNTAITGVVGPNGSGKSNVVEAFRFVLGEQSLKSMRGKKGEDMIFNGGKDLPRSNRASVKVVFDNAVYDINGNYKRLFESYSFDEVVVERAVNRDGTNEYLINGSVCRLKDITELLSEANIGGSGHHIISQGEADRLLSSSNKERKEMIEDALGLKMHQYKKEESEKRLVKTKEHMREVESLRRELAPHLRFLKKQVEKIEKAKELRSQLIELYKEYFAYETVLLDAEVKHIEEMKKQPTHEFAELEEKLKRIQETLSVTDTTSKLTDELFRLEQDLKNARHTKDGYSREIGRYEGEISYIERSIEKKKEKKNLVVEEVDAPVSRKAIMELIHKIKTTLSDIRNGSYTSPEEIKQASQDLIALCEAYTESVKDTHHVAVEHDTQEEEHELVRIQKLIAHAEKESAEAEQKEQHILSQYEVAKKRIEDEKEKNVESEKELLKVMSRQHEVRAELDKIDVRHSMYVTQKEAFEREMHEASALVGLLALRFSDVNTDVNLDPAIDKDVQKQRLHTLEKYKIRLEELGGAGDETIHREYTETEERDLFLANELHDLTTSLADLEVLIADITRTVAEMFEQGIEKINSQFSTFFKQMFGGGEARLVITQERKRKRKLTDLEDEEMDEEVSEEGEVEVGIDVFVSLPHKKLKGLSMLSGGERALTSIALLFAMSQVNPPPFIILDETDAALDEANSRRYGDMIELLSQHSELILVTHNRETMSRAGVLYGVTMGNGGYSQLLSIGFEEASVNAK
ncbi:MAG: AAA family ATPase [Patescibacteria group bacterium]